MSRARDRILKRLRSAKPDGGDKSLPPLADRTIFTNCRSDTREAVEAFAEKLQTLKGEFVHAKSFKEASSELRKLLQSISEIGRLPRVAGQRAKLIEELVKSDEWLSSNVTFLGDGVPNQELAGFDAGITTVDFLVARTGSLILSSSGSGGRRLSVLPPFHLAIATPDQIVSSLDEAIARFQHFGRNRLTSYATIITGPSRTADIEKILVLGAHGPKRLAVSLIEE